MEKTRDYFDCCCIGCDNIFKLTYFNDACPEDPDYIYASVHLKAKPFFKRLTHAVKYLFGFRSKYGDFDEILIDHDSAKRLAKLCTDYCDKVTGDNHDEENS